MMHMTTYGFIYFTIPRIEVHELRWAKLSGYVLHELPEDVWAEHPEHPVSDWQYEVSNGDTRLGYWDWLVERTGDSVEHPTWFEWVQVEITWPEPAKWGSS